MFNRIVNILLVILICLVGIGLYKHNLKPIKTYVEISHSIYKISNQCILDYYTEDLTTDGKVISMFPIVPQCKGKHLVDGIVKIYDEDDEQQAEVKAYELHGLMITSGGNATFMNKAVIRRLDNDKFVQDVTESLRKPENENDKSQEINFDWDSQKFNI